MTETAVTETTDPHLLALAPLRAALLARAHDEAEQLRAAAEQDGRRLLAAARDEAAALLAGARAQGEADATAALAHERDRSRAAARGIVLRAQSAAYDELRQHALAAVGRLLDDPAGRARLADALRHRLGGAADVRDGPDGGLIAQTSGGRSVDASIGALVESALSGLDLEQLWAAP